MRTSAAVAIVCGQSDAHADAVRSALEAEYALDVAIVDATAFPRSATASATVRPDQTGLSYSDRTTCVDVSALRSIWWRRPRRSEIENVYYGLPARDHLQLECDHFMQGLLWAHRGLWVNHPRNDLIASRKIVQLVEARRVGLDVPETLVTNDPHEARQFIEALQGPTVVKRVAAVPGLAAPTTLIDDQMQDRLDVIRHAPTIFQRYISGPLDVRVTWIAGEAWAAATEVDRSPTPEDTSFDVDANYTAHELPPAIRAGLGKLMTSLQLVFGALDLRVADDGTYYFLEINPAGQFLWIEHATRQPLVAALAATLAEVTR